MTYHLSRLLHPPDLCKAIRVVGFNRDGGVSRGHEGGTCSYFDGHLSICPPLPAVVHQKKGKKKKSSTIPFVDLQIAKLRVL